MRSIKLFIGVLALSNLAWGDSAVLENSPQNPKDSHSYSASYSAFESKEDEKGVQKTLDLKRNFKFMYVGAQPNPNFGKADEQGVVDKTYIAPDKSAMIKEYLPDGQVTEVDCRIVARDAILNLIGHRIVSNKVLYTDKKLNDVEAQNLGYYKDKNGKYYREKRFFAQRENEFEHALVARQFDQIFIKVGQPGFTCQSASVDEDTADCGKLFISVQPQAAQAGPYFGKKAIIFNPNVCEWYDENMSFEACETMAQISGCGLKEVLKASFDKEDNEALWGLEDKIQRNANRAMEKLQNRKAGARPSGPPPGFYNKFHAPAAKSGDAASTSTR